VEFWASGKFRSGVALEVKNLLLEFPAELLLLEIKSSVRMRSLRQPTVGCRRWIGRTSIQSSKAFCCSYNLWNGLNNLLEPTPTANQNGQHGNKKEPKEGYNKCSKGTSDNKKSATGKWCTFHNKSDTHNTEDCKVLNARKGDNKPPYKNKTWKKDADESKNYTCKELNALVKKLVNEEKKAWEKDQKANNKQKNKEVNTVEEEFPSDCSVATKDLDRQLLEEVDALLASMAEVKIDT
jgi:hypothetical protein